MFQVIWFQNEVIAVECRRSERLHNRKPSYTYSKEFGPKMKYQQLHVEEWTPPQPETFLWKLQVIWFQNEAIAVVCRGANAFTTWNLPTQIPSNFVPKHSNNSWCRGVDAFTTWNLFQYIFRVIRFRNPFTVIPWLKMSGWSFPQRQWHDVRNINTVHAYMHACLSLHTSITCRLTGLQHVQRIHPYQLKGFSACLFCFVLFFAIPWHPFPSQHLNSDDTTVRSSIAVAHWLDLTTAMWCLKKLPVPSCYSARVLSGFRREQKIPVPSVYNSKNENDGVRRRGRERGVQGDQ